jgi:peptide chain release factor 2
LPKKLEEIKRLEEQSQAGDFWDDPNSAQKIMRRLNDLQEETGFWTDFSKHVKDDLELLELIQEEADEANLTTLAGELPKLKADLQERELDLMFSGQYDDNPALLSINAREGGVDSQDWAEMLLRMYLRWAERKGFKPLSSLKGATLTAMLSAKPVNIVWCASARLTLIIAAIPVLPSLRFCPK